MIPIGHTCPFSAWAVSSCCPRGAHQRSRVDRRSVRIRLTAQGQEIRRIVDALYQKHVKTVEQVGGISNEEFATLNKSLHRLERFWTDQILYRL